MVTRTTKRHHRQHQPGHARAQPEHRDNHETQHQNVADNGDQAGGEQIVQHVHIRRDARDQPAHRILIEIGDVQRLQMRHQLPPQIEHGPLAGPLHQVRLAEVEEKPENDSPDKAGAQLRQARPSIVREPAINGSLCRMVGAGTR